MHTMVTGYQHEAISHHFIPGNLLSAAETHDTVALAHKKREAKESGELENTEIPVGRDPKNHLVQAL